MKSHIKTLDTELSGTSWVVNLLRHWESGGLWLYGDRSSCDSLRPFPLDLFIWLFTHILCDKTVLVSTELGWVLWVVPANYQTWELREGSLEFVDVQTKVQVAWRHLEFVAGVWSGAVSWDWTLNFWSLHWLWVVSEWTGIVGNLAGVGALVSKRTKKIVRKADTSWLSAEKLLWHGSMEEFKHVTLGLMDLWDSCIQQTVHRH